MNALISITSLQDALEINATDAKNRFGEVLENVAKHIPISLMRHGRPAAYVIPPETYELMRELLQQNLSKSFKLVELDQKFKRMLDNMQKPESVAVSKMLMGASDNELHKALRVKSTGKVAKTRVRRVA